MASKISGYVIGVQYQFPRAVVKAKYKGQYNEIGKELTRVFPVGAGSPLDEIVEQLIKTTAADVSAAVCFAALAKISNILREILNEFPLESR